MQKVRNIISIIGAFLFCVGFLNVVAKIFITPSIVTVLITSVISIFLVKKYFIPPFPKH